MDYVFGIDVGGTTVKIGLFTTEGTLVEKWEIPTNTSNGGKAILPDVAASLEEKLKERSIDKTSVKGAGIGVPGPVTDDGVVNHCVNLGWGIMHVTEELKALTGFEVKAGNDANVAALGEVWKGGGRGFDDVLMITIGTGIGGGLILNGKIHGGVTGSAAEVGHICVNPLETEHCNCGNCGCLEQYTSATGILRMAKKKLTESDAPSILRDKADLTTKDVIDAAKEGDALAMEVFDFMAKTMGMALAGCCALADMELILIGGGVSKAGRFLTDPIEKYFRTFAFHTQKDTKFKLAELGNDAGIYGAARMMIYD